MALTEDDLDTLSHEAASGGDPEEIAARILHAVDHHGLSDPEDASYALTVVAEIADKGGDLDRALELARRASAAHVPRAGASVSYADGYLGELLLRTGHEDEGMALLESFRPVMPTELLAGLQVAEALEAGGRTTTALDWLTAALEEAIRVGSDLDAESDDASTNAAVIYELCSIRHRLREDLDLGHDEYDELFHELDHSLAQQEPPDVLLFWPQAAFDSLRAQWPSVAEAWEPTWDEHRLALETTLQHWWGLGATDVVLLVASPDALTAFAATEELSLADPDDLNEAEQGYLDSLADDPQAVRQAWPPRRNEACWCGSGDKYKKCCLVRARTHNT